MAKIRAPMLLVTQPKDLVFTPDMVARTVKAAQDAGREITHVTIEGARGHLDGVISMKQAEGAIRAFLDK
ncbi:homoserine O-acetyltransferase [compost metagenome]